MNVLPFVFPLLRETKVPDTFQNSPPPSAVPRAQGWDRSRPSSCSLAPHSVFITEEAIHLSSEQASLQWATDGPRTANRIWRLSLLCYSSEAGPAGERLKGITVYQLWEIDEGIYSALHFISPATFPALSAFFANVLWESELFSPSGTPFQAEVEPCGTRMLCCSSYVIKLFCYMQFHGLQPWSLRKIPEPKF